MNALTLILTLLCLLLSACSKNPADSPNAHDTRFELLEGGADTCVLDTRTQLIWQQKTTEAGLNNADNTYSWFDPDEAVGELDYRGVEDGGVCTASQCDTWHYVQAVNRDGYCGHQDWRMPSKDELFSISDLRRAATPPTINTEFFPNTRAAEYWSGNDYSFQYDTAWAWNFEYGHDRVDWKKEAKLVRLVRGTAGPLEAVKE
ncbi:MAG: DUF1566 domain-containing protein [Gammaproteobacteria bacterium]|jgi:hypothetical protein|nr:DUF1566 domain-containing protein [Gammaproteobacteria bacterium]MDH5241313.1 DUF1566 domain-containing protein [Gammaproteobacteria bacterium]MDH5260290.1 DUF1566 domain-containing protein [Gammaproteobacteria bacterium]MDH5583464.1 DUF1566 domain-containing protein [Gammaproteobacteria bacterium]